MKIFYCEALYSYLFSLCGLSSCYCKVPHICYQRETEAETDTDIIWTTEQPEKLNHRNAK